MDQVEFINLVKDGAIRGWSSNKILPSLSIAQAILESGWGSSKLATESNNLFGIKASKDWTGPSKLYRTAEYDKNNNKYYINAAFRVYDSWNDSVADHAKFFESTEWRSNNYKKVIGESDYRKATKYLQEAGYATSQDYGRDLCNLIERYGLNQYDKVTEISTKPEKEPDNPKVESDNTDDSYDLVVYSNEIDEVPARLITKNLYIPSMHVNNYLKVQDRYRKVIHIGYSKIFDNKESKVELIYGSNRDETLQEAMKFIKSNK